MDLPNPSMDIFDFINEMGALDEALARHFFRQVVEMTIELKNAGIVHR